MWMFTACREKRIFTKQTFISFQKPPYIRDLLHPLVQAGDHGRHPLHAHALLQPQDTHVLQEEQVNTISPDGKGFGFPPRCLMEMFISWVWGHYPIAESPRH